MSEQPIDQIETDTPPNELASPVALRDKIMPAFIKAVNAIEGVGKSKTASVYSQRTGKSHPYDSAS